MKKLFKKYGMASCLLFTALFSMPAMADLECETVGIYDSGGTSGFTVTRLCTSEDDSFYIDVVCVAGECHTFILGDAE